MQLTQGFENFDLNGAPQKMSFQRSRKINPANEACMLQGRHLASR
jgi:hypothetical protein